MRYSSLKEVLVQRDPVSDELRLNKLLLTTDIGDKKLGLANFIDIWNLFLAQLADKSRDKSIDKLDNFFKYIKTISGTVIYSKFKHKSVA